MDIARNHFRNRALTLSYLDSAPDDTDRPVVMLLHGFPDEATMWTRHIENLHEAGYRCIAPDTLGCGHSEMAPRVRDYDALKIASDAIALLDHLGVKKTHVIGHDWGALIAWLIAGHYPERTDRLVVMSAGHPTAYARSNLRQKIMGWYVLFFQFGYLSERLLRGDGLLSLRKVFRGHPQMDAVMVRLREPGRMTAALRIYRAAIVPILLSKQPPVHADTLALWSDGDLFALEHQMETSEKFVVDGTWTFHRLKGHHWIPLENPDQVVCLVLEHLRAPKR